MGKIQAGDYDIYFGPLVKTVTPIKLVLHKKKICDTCTNPYPTSPYCSECGGKVVVRETYVSEIDRTHLNRTAVTIPDLISDPFQHEKLTLWYPRVNDSETDFVEIKDMAAEIEEFKSKVSKSISILEGTFGPVEVCWAVVKV